MGEYHKYVYEGEVMEFDNIIDRHWYGETMAPTEAKARSNLAYQCKTELGKSPRTRIILPGKIKIIN